MPRAAQLIAILSKSQYGLVQYPNLRGAQYLLKAKYLSNHSELSSVILAKITLYDYNAFLFVFQ